MALEASPSIPPSPPSVPPDLHPVLERLRQLPEFAPKTPGPLEQLMELPWMKTLTEKWQTGFQELMKNLQSLFGQLPSGSDTGFPSYLVEVASVVAGFLLVLLGVFAFYLLLGSIRRLLPVRATAPAALNKPFEDTLLISTAHHRAQAKELFQQGQVEPAVRQLYLAMLCLLEERKVASFEPTRSNAEYQRLLAPQPAVSDAFTGLARAFEQTRYGRQPLQPDQYQTCESGLDQAEQALGGAHG